MEEKFIIFQAVVPIGERRSMMNAWFKIQPTLKISGPFHARQPPFRLGTSSAFVGSSLYTIGGRVPNHFVLSDCISWLDTSNAFKAWETSKLPSRCVDSVLGVYGESLYIFPGVWKYGYYHMDEYKYLTTRKGYIWNTKENNCNKTGIIEPPTRGQWHRIRACASLDKEGLLIAMDGENNFFLYKPEKNDWEIRKFKDSLPKFIGETSFAASNGRLYILEVREKSPALLYIYDIKEGKLVIDQKPILEFDDDLWSMDEWDRVVRLVPVADNKLCFLWLGPVSYENESRWPPVRILHYLKFKVSGHSNSVFEVEDNKVFPTNITDLLDCLPWDLEQVEAEAKSKSQPLTQDVKLKAIIPAVTTMAARENAILFQAVVPSGERKLMMNAWFKIQPTAQIFGPFHGRQPFRLGISSTFVGSSLYTIGGKVPSSRLPKPCDISWLDTCSPFNGWETGELPSPCVDSVICVDDYSLYILTELEGYIWNTRDNQCLQTRIHLPRVEGRDQKQRPRIRGCAAVHGQGLLIAMDGENNTNLYLHPEPENEERNWERFGTPLPAFTNEISFAASKSRLYILEFPNNPPASLYIYDTNTREIVQNHKIDSLILNDLWTVDEKDRVVHLVPVADDMLCFLWLVPFENKNRWPPVKTLYYLKLKFSFNPIKFEIVDDKSFHTNITDLLNCLPCGCEQFRAEVDPLDAFQKQLEDTASTEEIGTSLISDHFSVGGEPFQDQAENIPCPKEGERKRERTHLVDPSPPQKFEKLGFWEEEIGVVGKMKKRRVVVRRMEEPSRISPSVRYRECQKNHAASMGGYAVDGCGEFLPSGEDGTTAALNCTACDCHRSFHRREVDTEDSPCKSITGTTAALSPSVRYRECQKNHAASVGAYIMDGCGEFLPSGEDGTTAALNCTVCDCHRSFHRREVDTKLGFSEEEIGVVGKMRKHRVVVRRMEEPSRINPSVRYRECQKNHAASVGRYAVYGCREFMARGEDGTAAALNCAAFGCHRSFHRREVDTKVVCESSSPPNSSNGD